MIIYVLINVLINVFTLNIIVLSNTKDKIMIKLTMRMNWGQLITANFHTMSQAIRYSALFSCVTERKLSNAHGAVWVL